MEHAVEMTRSSVAKLATRIGRLKALLTRMSSGRDAGGLSGEISRPFDTDSLDPQLAREQSYRVEALEPRILLSADPMLGELARIADDAYHFDPQIDMQAVIQQVDELYDQDENAADFGPEFDVPDGKVGIDWPEGWVGSEAGDGGVALWLLPADIASGGDKTGGLDLYAVLRQILVDVHSDLPNGRAYGVITILLKQNEFAIPYATGPPPADLGGIPSSDADLSPKADWSPETALAGAQEPS